MMVNNQTVDGYITGFPDETQEILNIIRKTIKEAAPDAKEVISYRMPAFKLNNRILVYFAAYNKHIGFYPTASGIEAFREEITGYETSKGTVKFPINKDMPLELIRRIVKYRVAEIAGIK
jgi:uncharacterized protein YdhG (YjbR/CyaY superfamily)